MSAQPFFQSFATRLDPGEAVAGFAEVVEPGSRAHVRSMLVLTNRRLAFLRPDAAGDFSMQAWGLGSCALRDWIERPDGSVLCTLFHPEGVLSISFVPGWQDEAIRFQRAIAPVVWREERRATRRSA